MFHRWIFEAYHWWIGRCAAGLAIADTFIGLRLQGSRFHEHYVAAYAVVAGLLVLIYLLAGVLR